VELGRRGALSLIPNTVVQAGTGGSSFRHCTSEGVSTQELGIPLHRAHRPETDGMCSCSWARKAGPSFLLLCMALAALQPTIAGKLCRLNTLQAGSSPNAQTARRGARGTPTCRHRRLEPVSPELRQTAWGIIRVQMGHRAAQGGAGVSGLWQGYEGRAATAAASGEQRQRRFC
jgi:hypothetical protein